MLATWADAEEPTINRNDRTYSTSEGVCVCVYSLWQQNGVNVGEQIKDTVQIGWLWDDFFFFSLFILFFGSIFDVMTSFPWW